MESPLPPEKALQEHAAFVHALAGRLVTDPQTADDLAQETWLAVLEHPPRHPSKLRGWLATTLRRFAGRLERGKRRRAYRERAVARPEGLPSAADDVSHEDLIQTMAAAVLELGEPYRRTVIRRYYLGMSAAEIGRNEGIPSGTVRSRLKRALDELRGRLDRRFGDRETWSVALLALGRRWKPIAVTSTTTAAAGGILSAVSVKLVGCAALAAALFFLPRLWNGGGSELEGLEARDALAREATTEAGLPPDATRSDGELLVDTPEVARTQVTAAGAATTTLRILEWDGRPNGDLLCLLLDRNGETRSARSNEGGVVVFDETGGPSTLVVERRGAPPHRAAIDLFPGDHELRLPRGEELSGTILVGGLPPEKPLRLVAYQAASRHERVTWNEDHAELFLRTGNAPATTWTQADGSFRFVGLAADWRGNLRLPRGYAEAGTLAAASAYERLAFFHPEPTADVFLELDRFPSLRGRILDADGRPALRGVADVFLTWKNGTNMTDGAQCEEDGCFELFLDEEVRAASVRYWQSPGRSGETEAVFDEEHLPADGDLGDLVLGGARSVELFVEDADGNPIAGAVTSLESSPTDEAGRTKVEGVGEKTDSVRVAARGFHSARLALAPNDTQLVAVLERATTVALRLVTADDRPLARKRVELASAEPLFAYDEYAVAQPNTMDKDLYAGQWVRGISRSGDVRVLAEVDADGLLTMGGLRPGVPFTVRVYSAGGRVLYESQLEPLDREEARELLVVVEQELRTYRGTVLDELGRPLPEAAVHVVTEGSANGGTSRRTDAGGRFEIPWVAADAGRLTISKEGYLPLVVDDQPLVDGGAGDEDARFALTPGHTVTVRVIDELGLDVPYGSVGAILDDEYRDARPIGEATHELVGLVDEPVEVRLRVGGKDYARTHDPREPELTFVVPAHGSVEVVWAATDDVAWSEWIDVELVPLDEELPAQDYTAHGVPQGDHTFPLVLPGEYEVFVVRDDEEELTERVPVVVEAGQTTRVELP